MKKPFIVAEIGGNHMGRLSRALVLIGEAASAGADAVKFQCFTPEQMADPETVVKSGTWVGRNLLELYRETHTPREWFPSLFDTAKKLGLVPFASVFHPDDVDFLETLDCKAYKISSFELSDFRLIEHAASKGKGIVLSTGMATEQEIRAAFSTAVNAATYFEPDVSLLKCTSAYPADASDANLETMVDLSARFGCVVGLSDHTPGIGVAVAATAMGAEIIEKHLTISRADGGPDAEFSMEPSEFAQMVTECRRAAAAIGTVRYGPTQSEASSLPFRRKPGGKRG